VSARAGVARRLAATLYESLLLAALALVVGFAMLPVLNPAPLPATGDRALPLLKPWAQVMSSACLFVVLGAYCVWGWSGGRRTLPMRTWRIAMELASGARVSMSRAAPRYVAWWIGPVLAVAAYAALRPALGFSESTPAQTKTSDVVRLSSNENPYGPSPAALKAMTAAFAQAWKYPDETQEELVDALANSIKSRRSKFYPVPDRARF